MFTREIKNQSIFSLIYTGLIDIIDYISNAWFIMNAILAIFIVFAIQQNCVIAINQQTIKLIIVVGLVFGSIISPILIYLEDIKYVKYLELANNMLLIQGFKTIIQFIVYFLMLYLYKKYNINFQGTIFLIINLITIFNYFIIKWTKNNTNYIKANEYNLILIYICILFAIIYISIHIPNIKQIISTILVL